MSGFYGSDVKDPNFRLRFFVIVAMGILAFGSILFWRSALLFSSEYQEMPVTHRQVKVKKHNQAIQDKLLKGYQLEE